MTPEKQKAIIEAMLFVSTQPVPLTKIVKKLRLISRRERDENETTPEILDAVGFMAENGDAINDNAIFVAAIEENSENAQDCHSERSEESPELDGGSFADAQDDNDDALDEVKQASDGSVADDTATETASDDNAGDDVLAQLLNKQKELEDDITAADVKTLLTEMTEEFNAQHRGLELAFVAKGYQLRTKYDIAAVLRDEKLKAPTRFSPSSLETLAIVAYQQPITRQKLEDIRGVDSGGVLKTLLDKSIVRVVGRSDEPGKPLVYGTSNRFLEIFGMKNLNDMPSLSDYNSLHVSQQRDLAQGDRYDTSDIVVDDLVDSQYADDMNDDDNELMNDLESSLKNLKSVEKEIFPPEVEAQAPVDDSAPTPVDGDGGDATNA